jgi:hypothetical protein
MQHAAWPGTASIHVFDRQGLAFLFFFGLADDMEPRSASLAADYTFVTANTYL